MAEKVIKNPSRALDITTNLATAAASGNPKKINVNTIWTNNVL